MQLDHETRSALGPARQSPSPEAGIGLCLARWVLYALAGVVCAPIVIPLFLVWLVLGGLYIILYHVVRHVWGDSVNAVVDCAVMVGFWRSKCSRFVQACRSPHTQDLLCGLPVCFLLLGVMCPCGLAIILPGATEDRYRAAALGAIEAKDYVAANVYCRRLNNTPENRLLLARTCEALGQREQCDDVMRDVAKGTGQAAGVAHLWLANQIMASPASDGQTQLDLCNHLAAAAEQFPEDTRLQRRLGELYLQRGESLAATNHLARAVRADPKLALLVARLYLAQGDRAQGGWLAHQALAYWNAQLERDPHDGRARRFAAGARLLLGDYAEAVACLEQAPAKDRDLSVALAAAYVAWADELLVRKKKKDVSRLASLLASALESDPLHLAAIDRIARLSSVKKPEFEPIRNLWQKLDVQHAPAPVLVVLAGVCSDRRDYQTARRHLERALKIDPTSVPAANNLACLLARAGSPDLPRALALVNGVLGSSGADKAEVLDTRATILMKIGQPVAALNDWGQALQLHPATVKTKVRFAAALNRCIGLACRF